MAVEDLQELENQLSSLDNRVTELEYDASAEGASPGDAVGAVEVGEEFWVEPSTVLGEDVTVSADVSEVVTANGAAFRIAGDSGDPVAVIATHPPDGMEVGDTVRVTGAVKQIQRSSFEQDFGWAADELFDDPDDFFGEAEGEVAIAATEVEPLDDSAE